MKSRLFIILMTAIFFLVALASCSRSATPPSAQKEEPSAARLALEIKMGNDYYHGSQYRCYACHGMHGEGGRGPKLQGIAKKMGWEALMRKATHMCPPTGACPPDVLQSIGRYLQTL